MSIRITLLTFFSLIKKKNENVSKVSKILKVSKDYIIYWSSQHLNEFNLMKKKRSYWLKL